MAIGVLISSFPYFGVPTLSQVFGYYAAPSAVQVQRVQISAQTPPVGGSISITLVNQAGTALAAAVVLPSGSSYYDNALAAPITLAPGQVVRAQITGVDSGVAENLTVNLIGATAEGSSAPSGCGGNECAPPAAQLLFFKGSVQQEVVAAQAAQAGAEAAKVLAQSAELGAFNAQAAAVVAQAGAEAANANAVAQVALASGYATNANNAATAALVYSNDALASKNAAQIWANEAAVSAAEAQSGIKSATLQLTPASVQAIPDATPTAVQWNNAMYDDLVFFDPVNPTRLTIPAAQGIVRVRLTAGVRWAASAVGNRSIKLRTNPVGTYPANTFIGSNERPTGATGDIQVMSAIILVEAGRYFEVIVEQNSGGPLDINTATVAANIANFFTIEVLNRIP